MDITPKETIGKKTAAYIVADGANKSTLLEKYAEKVLEEGKSNIKDKTLHSNYSIDSEADVTYS